MKIWYFLRTRATMNPFHSLNTDFLRNYYFKKGNLELQQQAQG